MAIWAFRCNAAGGATQCNAKTGRYELSCEGKGDSCTPSMAAFSVFIFLAIMYNILKQRGMVGAPRGAGGTMKKRAYAMRQQLMAAGDSISLPAVLSMLINQGAVVLIVCILVADVCADIPVQIQSMQAANNQYWVIPVVMPLVILIFTSLWVSEQVGLAHLLTTKGLQRALRRPDFSKAYEAYAFVLTLLAVLFYMLGTYSTAAFRKGDAATLPNNLDKSTNLLWQGMTEGKCTSMWSDEPFGDAWPERVQEVISVGLRIDYVYRFSLAKLKVAHFFGVQNLMDFLSVSDMPAWIAGFEYFPMTNSFGFLKYLRILRGVNLKGVREYLGPVKHKLVHVILAMLGTFFVFSGFILTMEFPRTHEGYGSQYWGIVCWHDAFYFAIITLTTVGFGDYSPKTAAGRLLSCIALILGIGIISTHINKLMEALEKFTPYTGKYNLSKENKHVIVVGRWSFHGMRAFLTEFFHENHGMGQHRKVVLLSLEPPEQSMVDLMEETQFAGRIRFLTISGNDAVAMAADLRRAGILDTQCEGVFVLSDQHSQSPEDEDSRSIRWTMVTKKVAPPGTRIIVQVIRAENKMHVTMAGAQIVICASEFKFRLMAHSLFAAGVTTLVGNLIRSSDYNGSSYADGCDWEIYEVPLTGAEGRSFSEVALNVWNKSAKMKKDSLPQETGPMPAGSVSGLLVIGIKSASTGHNNVRLNPGRNYHIQEGDMAIVLAEDIDAADEIASYLDGELSRQDKKLAAAAAAVTRRRQSQRAPYSPQIDLFEGKHEEPRGIELALKRSVQGKMRGHCVLCGASVGLEQLVVHVRSFRPDHPTNIVLLTETEPTPLVWEQIALEGVFVIKGSPLSRMDLQRAACQDASMVVVLADHSSSDADMMDTEVIKIGLAVRSLRAHAELYTLMELNNTANLVFLDPTHWWPKRPEVEFGLAPIFAAGRVFTSSILDTLVCQAFFNASIPKIIHELVRGDAPIRHTVVPSAYVGKTYGELVIHLMEEEALLPVAVYAHQDSSAAHEMVSSDVTAEGSRKKKTSRLTRIPSGNPASDAGDESHASENRDELLPVLVTNPAPAFRLSAGDLILVIPSNDDAVPAASTTGAGGALPLVQTPTAFANTVV